MDNQNEKDRCVNCGIRSVPLYLGLDDRLHCADHIGLLLPPDKPEQMDSVTLQEFGQWLEQEGLQAIATRVSTGDECSVIIEDGYSVDTRPAQPVQPEPLTPPIIQKAWTKGAF